MISRKLFRQLLCLYIIILPCFFHHFVDLRISQETVYQMGSIILIICSMLVAGQKQINFNANIWVVVFGLWSIFNYIYYNFYVGSNVLQNIFLGIVLYLMLIKTLQKEDIKSIFKAITFVCFLNLGYLLVQKFLHYDPIYRQVVSQEVIDIRNATGVPLPSNIELTGFFGLKASMGIYFAIAIPILAYFNMLLPLICIFPIYMSVSTIANIGAGAGYIFYAFYFQKEVWAKNISRLQELFEYYKAEKMGRLQRFSNGLYLLRICLSKLRYTIVFFGMTALLLTLIPLYIVKVDNPMGMQTTRLSMWKNAVHIGLQKPLTGWGLDSFRKIWLDKKEVCKTKNFAFYRIENEDLTDKNVVLATGMKVPEDVLKSKRSMWDNPHNEVIQLLFETGLPSLVFVIMFIIGLYKRFKNAVKSREAIAVTGALLVLLFCGLTHFPLHLARIAHLCPILLGIFVICTERKNNETKISYN